MPIDTDAFGEDMPTPFAHTVLSCESGTSLPYEVRDLAAKYGERAPRDLRTWMGRDGESYGKTNQTPLGKPLQFLRAKHLRTLARNDSIRHYVMHRAAWAFIAALPDEFRVALYFH